MATIRELEKWNERLHAQTHSREKYYLAAIVGVVMFFIGYVVGKF